MTSGSVFDIIGPAMIGPSSSHTAGAVRLGRVALSILGEKPVRAEITLYGSFAKTYKGHGTDKALVGGLLNMDTDDSRIRDALPLAASCGLVVIFSMSSRETAFPNTAGITLTGSTGRKVFVEGSSVGGGNIMITKVNEFTVNVCSKYPTILVEHLDQPGVIGRVATILGERGINIGQMTVVRPPRGIRNLMVAETDQDIPETVQKQISGLPEVTDAVYIGSV